MSILVVACTIGLDVNQGEILYNNFCMHSKLIIVIYYATGLGAVNFTDPASGSLIANFEGTENATTITCNVTNSQGAQISTQWALTNFRGSTGLQLVNNAAPELFEITGDPIPNTMFTFINHLTVVNLVRDLDHVTVFCGTGVMPQQANFLLRIYRELNFKMKF